ncbi:MAG TPA: TIR domain-containing protein [Thermoanaerobaculia bacterium]|nr:TIR domain-containing protein [Thermoanaerobaculia bacterium]
MHELEQPKKYDVALSYAREDGEYVDAVAHALRNRGLKVFYDRFEEADIIGRNLIDHLANVYRSNARLCVVFISEAYARKPFPRLERQSAQVTAIETDAPYIIPVRLDGTPLPGLLANLAYTRNKTPEALAELVASKLLRGEAVGVLSKGVSIDREACVVRYRSLIEPDMDTFRTTFARFEGWADSKIGSIPIDLRMPRSVSEAIRIAREFRDTPAWRANRISEEARASFSKFYDTRLPERNQETIRGISILLQHYHDLPPERRDVALRNFLASRAVVLCRQILMYQLVGMESISWEQMFSRIGSVWDDQIILGLSYVAFLDGDEPYFWIDADGRDGSGTIVLPRSLRLYVPASLEIKERLRPLNADAFDRHFAAQICAIGFEEGNFMALWNFAHYPEQLQLSIRGEWAIEADHFTSVSTRELIPCVTRLVNDLSKSAERESVSLIRLEHLFGPNRHYYEDILRKIRN